MNKLNTKRIRLANARSFINEKIKFTLYWKQFGDISNKSTLYLYGTLTFDASAVNKSAKCFIHQPRKFVAN